MYKKLLIWIIIMFSLVNIVISAAPITQVSLGDEGIEILYPQYEFTQQNRGFNLHTHIFNKSSGLPMDNTTSSCYVHLYNSTGDHILRSEMEFDKKDIFDFKISINEANFSLLGLHSFIIQCNTSAIGEGGIGGFISGKFIVTTSGEGSTISLAIFYLIAILMLVVFLILVIYSLMKSNNIIKSYIYVCLIYILAISLSFIGWSLARNFLTSNPFIESFLYIIFIILMILVVPFILCSFIYLLYLIYQIKAIQNMVNKGIPYEEAKKRAKRK